MSDPNLPSTDGARQPPADQVDKVTLTDWALAILLTILVGLSAAALLSATFMELLFDKLSAVTRLVVLLPVLLISSFLLVKKWRKLMHRHDAAKK